MRIPIHGEADLMQKKIKGPNNPTCQLLPKDNERKVKVQEWTERKKGIGDWVGGGMRVCECMYVFVYVCMMPVWWCTYVWCELCLSEMCQCV